MNKLLAAIATTMTLFTASVYAQDGGQDNTEVVKNDGPQGETVPQQDGSNTTQTADCGCGKKK